VCHCWLASSVVAAGQDSLGKESRDHKNRVAWRREVICYQEFRAKSWQIGSAPTEAARKATTRRVKGHSHRWDSDIAEAITALAALTDSRQRLQRRTSLDPQRNHPRHGIWTHTSGTCAPCALCVAISSGM